jgi:hypothetical protein
VDPSIDRTAPRTGRSTTDEDNKLKKAAEKYNAVAALVPSRTKRQCRKKWCNTLDASIDISMAYTGKWTADEDSKLKDSVARIGVQYYGRCHNVLTPVLSGLVLP